jgi:hypothetical protein
MSFPHACFSAGADQPLAESGNPGPSLYSGSPIETFGDDNLKPIAAKALTEAYETASNTASHFKLGVCGIVLLTPKIKWRTVPKEFRLTSAEINLPAIVIHFHIAA